MEDEFQAACELATNKLSNIDNQYKLQLYALFKQGTIGKCNVASPPFYDLVGKAKWQSWQSLGDLPVEEAKKQYIDFVEHLLESGDKVQENHGPTISIMQKPKDQAELNIFEKIREGELSDKFDPNQTDEDGMTLLHWAADGGHLEVVFKLIKAGANVNAKDQQQQTPLHIAMICGHESVIMELIKNGGRYTNEPDDEGNSPIDLLDDTELKERILNHKM